MNINLDRTINERVIFLKLKAERDSLNANNMVNCFYGIRANKVAKTNKQTPQKEQELREIEKEEFKDFIQILIHLKSKHFMKNADHL